jgi:hypothetical protein
MKRLCCLLRSLPFRILELCDFVLSSTSIKMEFPPCRARTAVRATLP